MSYEKNNSGLDRNLKAAGIDMEVLKSKTITYSYFGKEPGDGVLSDVQMKLVQYISGSSAPRKILVRNLEGSFNPNYYHGGQTFCGEIDLYKALCEVSGNDAYSIKSFIEATLTGKIPTNINVITINGKSYINHDGNHRMLFLKAMYEQELSEGKSQEELDQKYVIDAAGVEVPQDKEEQTCIGILGKLNSRVVSNWGKAYNTPCFEMIVEDGVCKGYILTVKETGEKVELRGKDELVRYTKEAVDRENLNEMLRKIKRIDMVPFDLENYSESLELLDENARNKMIEKYKLKAAEIQKVQNLLERLKKKFENQEVTQVQLRMIQEALPDEYLSSLHMVENASYAYQRLFYDDATRATTQKILELIMQDKKSDFDWKIEQLQSQRLGFFDRLFGKEKIRDLQIKNLKLQKESFQIEDLDINIESEPSKILEEYISKNGMNSELRDFILQNSDSPVIGNLIIPELFAKEREGLVSLKSMSLREISIARESLEKENEMLARKLKERNETNHFEHDLVVSKEETEINQRIVEFSGRLDQILVLTGLEQEKINEEHEEKN